MILVLTPLLKESELLISALVETGWQCQNEKKGSLKGFLFKDAAVSVFVGGHGKVQFAVQTQHVLQNFAEARAVLCIGAAGSLTESVKPGDLVIGDPTIEHDFRLKFIERPLPAFSPDPALRERAQAVRPSGYAIHLGPIASGDEDVLETARAAEIVSATGALAVAWEGAGGARAAKFLHVPYMEVRAVTDSANKDAPAEFEKNLAVGLRNAAHFLRQFVSG